MRIDSLELSWFRGAGALAVLKTQGKSLAVYGANGAGKSSFADALEYIAAGGSIAHLAHEYSGLHQRLGLRNTHAPAGVPAVLTLRFQGKAWLQAAIQPGGGAEIQCDPANLVDTIQSWDIKRFILRQDEVARFIHATKGEKYSALLPLLGLDPLEHAAANLHALQKALAERGKQAHKEQQRDSLHSSILEHLPDLDEKTIRQSLDALVRAYLSPDQPVGDSIADRAAAIEQAILQRIHQAEPEQKRGLILQQMRDERLERKLADLEQAEATAELATSAFIDRRIAVLEPARDYLAALESEAQIIECPACGREIDASQFAAHVHGELEELTRARDARSAVIRARQALQAGLSRVLSLAGEPSFSAWLAHPDQAYLKAGLDGLAVEPCEPRWSLPVWESLRRAIPQTCAAVEAALRQAPPSAQALFQGAQTIASIARLPELGALTRELEALGDLIRTVKDAETAVRQTIKSRTRAIMGRVSAEIQRLWARLHPDEPIEAVSLYIPGDAEKAIDICLKFYGVDQPSPRLTLSEGHRNSLGLCIFLALVSLEADQSRPIILDDVVSSMDREHRGRLAKILLEDFASRQVVLLTHDREWYTELRWRLPEKGWSFAALHPWQNPQAGIQWAQSKDTFDDARSLLALSPEAAGNRARAIMDTQLAIITERLRLRLIYARGDRNDHRTCIEFLERIIGDAPGSLRRMQGESLLGFPEPIADWKEAHALLGSWANRASHTGSLTAGEVEELIAVCERSLARFRCPSCGEPLWYAEQPGRERMQCSCGALVWVR